MLFGSVESPTTIFALGKGVVHHYKDYMIISRKEEIQEIIGTDFLTRFLQATGRRLSIVRFGDKPDLACKDTQTKKTVGIEITELLDQRSGKERALSNRTYHIVEKVLKKYKRGGIVSIGRCTRFPDKREDLARFGNTLDLNQV